MPAACRLDELPARRCDGAAAPTATTDRGRLTGSGHGNEGERVRSDHVRYGLLGPVQATRDGAVLDLGPRQRRALLARLLLADSRPVPVRDLCADLWPGRPPTGAASSVRAHVSRLRATLDPGRPGRETTVLTSEPTGYRLAFATRDLDVKCFEESVAFARAALARGDLDGARGGAEGALRLCRGRPLAELDDYLFAQVETERLVSLRQDAAELRAMVLLRQGDLDEALTAAERLIAEAPLREASWALTVRALYRSGRSVEALRCFERFQRTLKEELGLDPSPAMRELHTAVLRHSADLLDGPAGGPVELGSAAPGPAAPRADATGAGPFAPDRSARPDARSLPAPGSAARLAPVPLHELPLVGREHEIAALDETLTAAASGRSRWTIVSGAPGSGRSRLLAEAAARATAAGFTVVRSGGPGAYGDSADPAARLLDQLPGTRGERPQAGTGADAGPAGPGPSGAPDAVTALLAALRGAAATAPVLCLVDDLDEAPAAFAGLLRQVAGLLPELPVAVVVAVRDVAPGVTGGLLADLARRGAVWLEPEPLTRDQVALLTTARDGAGPPDQAGALHERTGGNPFVLAQFLALPPERRIGPRARVPAAVRGVVEARLARLDQDTRAMLDRAALDGPAVDIDLLARVCATTPDELLARVEAALREGVLVWEPEPDGLTGRYLFPELSREVVRVALTPPARQRLHAALARELSRRDAGERDGPDRDGLDRDRLDRHLRAAGPLGAGAGPPGPVSG